MIRIIEGKYIGILYRFQDVRSMKSLLDTDILELSSSGYISLTRNKNHPSSKIRVGLVLDGDKLSNNYKIKPYCNSGEIPIHKEQEERLYKSVKNISKYILYCSIPKRLLSDEVIFINSEYESCSDMIRDIEDHNIRVRIY